MSASGRIVAGRRPAGRSGAATFGPLAYFIRRYPGRFGGLLAVAFVAAVAEALALAAFYPLLTAVLGGALTAGGTVLGAIGQAVGAFPPEQRLIGSLALFLAAVVASASAKFLREWATASVSTQVSYDVKRQVFARLLGAPYLHLAGLPPGEIVYRVTNAPPYLATTLLITSQMGSLVLTAVTVVLLLATIELRLTALVTVLGLAFYLLNRYVLLGTLAEAGRKRVAAALAEAGIASEYSTAAKEVAVAGVGHVWLARFLGQADAHRRNLRRDLVVSVVPGLTMEATVLGAIGVVAVIVRLAAPDLLGSALPIVAVYGLAVRQLLNVLSQLSRHWLRLAGLSAEVRLLRDALTEPYPAVRSGARTVPDRWRSIEIVDVGVRYPGRESPAVAGVTMQISRGSSHAIVGPSGSGKSTILALLLRLFDPSDGAIRVDGVDLADVDRAAWTRRIGYVAQDGFIADASVTENIDFGRDLDRAAIERAAAAANAVEFIERLPDGYDTRLGERGSKLSAGQRQRLLIARALAHRPELLLLDEATSALDSRSEQLVQDALVRLRGEHTLVVVGHRLSAVRGADTIIVLDHGHVVEVGDHDALMRRGGTYAELARIQGAVAPAG